MRIEGARHLLAFGSALLALGGCTQKMGYDGHLRPYAPAPGSGGTRPLARPLPEGTIPRDSRGSSGTMPGVAAGYEQGFEGNAPVKEIPVRITRPLLQRGRQRYEIYCAPCHGLTGDGNGMIVQRGFLAPPSYHSDRLRNAPAGHFFDVITNGYNAMYSYSDRVGVADRWAIVAYIRALQLSQGAKAADLPPEDREKLPREKLPKEGP